MNKSIKIGTHSGYFHADEIFAVSFLKKILSVNKEEPYMEVIRTRDTSILSKCHYIIDVGGIYDPDKSMFDHHFKNAPCRDNGIPYSSFGMVWEDHKHLLGLEKDILDKIEEVLVMPIDATDNGVETFQCKNGICPLTIQSIISNFYEEDNEDEIFNYLVSWAYKIINSYIKKCQEWHESKHIILESLNYALENNLSYIELPRYLSWQEHLLMMDKTGSILYVIYPKRRDDNLQSWFAITVPETIDNLYSSKKLFPESWRGLRDRDLDEETELNGTVFCHHSGFACAAYDRQTLLNMVEKALVYE